MSGAIPALMRLPLAKSDQHVVVNLNHVVAVDVVPGKYPGDGERFVADECLVRLSPGERATLRIGLSVDDFWNRIPG